MSQDSKLIPKTHRMFVPWIPWTLITFLEIYYKYMMIESPLGVLEATSVGMEDVQVVGLVLDQINAWDSMFWTIKRVLKSYSSQKAALRIFIWSLRKFINYEAIFGESNV